MISLAPNQNFSESLHKQVLIEYKNQRPQQSWLLWLAPTFITSALVLSIFLPSYRKVDSELIAFDNEIASLEQNMSADFDELADTERSWVW